jgi:hypothetical protein
MDLDQTLLAFKNYHNIPESHEFEQGTGSMPVFKHEDNGLFVKYNQKWVRLNYKKEPEKFRMKSSLGIQFSNKFMLALIPTPLVPYPTGEYPELKNDPSCQWVSAKAKKCKHKRRPKNLYCWNHNTQIQNGAGVPKPPAIQTIEECVVVPELGTASPLQVCNPVGNPGGEMVVLVENESN